MANGTLTLLLAEDLYTDSGIKLLSEGTMISSAALVTIMCARSEPTFPLDDFADAFCEYPTLPFTMLRNARTVRVRGLDPLERDEVRNSQRNAESVALRASK